MAAKVDSTTSAETGRVHSAVSVSTSSTVSSNSPKISIFGAKSGFVIPKNKLSGSLVPLNRGGGKLDSANSAKEDAPKQVQRKTKWGPDLTLDASVRKGRVLAYQTRLEQITEQLNSGALEIGHNQNPLSTKQDLDDDSASHLVDKESSKLQLLELEKREVIGEILRLNPSYKPPADYKPLLKETDIPIPINTHPGYNFIGLLLGHVSNTQKRLEEETGAKVRVFGTKTASKEKHEITYSDKNDAKDGYEELHVNISADTYEKVDAAVALIELLITPVSGTSVGFTSSTSQVPVRSDNVNMGLKEIISSSMILATSDASQGFARPLLVAALPNQLQYQPFAAPWPQVVQASPRPLPNSGYMPSLSNNSSRFPAPPFGATPFGGLPPPTLATRPQLPQPVQQLLNHAPPPTNHAGQHPPSAYHTMISPIPPVAASQPIPTGAMPGSLPSRPLTSLPPGHPGWSNSSVPLPQRPMMLPQSTPPMRHVSVTSPVTASVPNAPSGSVSGPLISIQSQQNIPTPEANRPLAAHFAPPVAFASQPGATHFTPVLQTGPISSPAMAPLSSGALLPTMPSAQVPPNRPVAMLPGSATPMQPPPIIQTAAAHGGRPQISPAPQAPTQSPPVAPVSVPGGLPGFANVSQPPNASTTSPIAAPRPPRPLSGDFTFQPLGAQVPASSTPPRRNIQSIQHMGGPVAVPQPPSFRPALQNPASSVNPQGFPSSLILNQTNISQSPIRPPPSPGAPFSVDPAVVRQPPNLPAFSDSNTGRMMGLSSQMVPGFPSTPQSPILPSMPARPAPFIQASLIPLHPANRPNNPMVPVQQMGSKPPDYVASVAPSNAGGNQIYDPFSPTSVSSAHSKAEDNRLNARKTEPDAEYEDLMASVGVK